MKEMENDPDRENFTKIMNRTQKENERADMKNRTIGK
jgi:hypothetical protein